MFVVDDVVSDDADNLDVMLAMMMMMASTSI